MQFPESWLREFCNPPLSTEALAELLTMAGMEVEDTQPVAPMFTKVVVAQVLAIEPHPNAERLQICQVDVGGDVPLSIVCGASNVRVGIKVPCAQVGAILPPMNEADGKAQPFEIKLGMLRGIPSQGMLCSAGELKLLGYAEDGLLVLEPHAVVGRNLREQLNLDDTLFTLKLTPNLGHCLSVYGVAREVSALTGAPLVMPQIFTAPVAHQDTLAVSVEASNLCGRYSGRIVRHVNAKAQTPVWMVDRLARCGQRSVTPLVDISNYVMFESGQPSHIFDLDRLHGGLVVRWGRPGEAVKLLNGVTIEVDEAVGVIADEEQVESLAGIVGGSATAVSENTQNVYVEAAFWWPEAVSGRARRFNFSTDAAHRFERGVDADKTVAHLERITQLILEICGGEAGPVHDQTLDVPQRLPVLLRVSRANKVIGMPVTQMQCENVMRRLNLNFESLPGQLMVVPPSWRFDIQIEEDLIEEVIRVLGYATLPSAPPKASLTARVRSESQRGPDSLRHRMAALEYQETINFSFVEERWEHELAGNTHPIRLLNPMSSQWSVMRSSLIGSLINVLQFNLARKAIRVRVFEAGRVFLRAHPEAAVAGAQADSIPGIHQPVRLAGLAFGSAEATQWSVKERPVDFFDIKGDIEDLCAPQSVRFIAGEHAAMHPGRCAHIEIGAQMVGVVGELHPRWRQAYDLPTAPLLFEIDQAVLLRTDLPVFVPVAKQQAVWRDIALIANDTLTHDALLAAIAATESSVVRSAKLFDVYKPNAANATMEQSERSLAVRLELLDNETPLTEERIEGAVAAVLARLSEQLGVRLRGAG
jgi:phenylalanyl-tRNA synthetase beta chain